MGLKKIELKEKDIRWFQNASEKDLQLYEQSFPDLERKGYDTSEFKSLIAERRTAMQHEDEANELKRQEFLRNIPKYQLDRLEAYKKTPRSTDTEFFTDVAGKAPLFGKGKWREKYENAPLVFGSIVQANDNLWEPGNGEMLPAVVVFALDEAHKYDKEWLIEIANKIAELRDAADVPDDCKSLISQLRNSQSYFNFKVGASIAGSADAWCGTFHIDKQADLGNKCLPEDGIIPLLVCSTPRDNYNVDFKLVPAKYYL